MEFLATSTEFRSVHSNISSENMGEVVDQVVVQNDVSESEDAPASTSSGSSITSPTVTKFNVNKRKRPETPDFLERYLLSKEARESEKEERRREKEERTPEMTSHQPAKKRKMSKADHAQAMSAAFLNHLNESEEKFFARENQLLQMQREWEKEAELQQTVLEMTREMRAMQQEAISQFGNILASIFPPHAGAQSTFRQPFTHQWRSGTHPQCHTVIVKRRRLMKR
ncbi:hypothetical protein DPX16_15638 [Anabarilius grahami]|uniref:Uncharacterized protein n=1 Tax=Anabarilius grahami TaxID=495550 RepID=A0A3N0YSZ5_ANAGA|nr:hypothetical protein DPX16_15638 [Anabarilius grahami]